MVLTDRGFIYRTLIAAIVTQLVTGAAMMLVFYGSVRTDLGAIKTTHVEMATDIREIRSNLEQKLSTVEASATGRQLQTEMDLLDARVTRVETGLHNIDVQLTDLNRYLRKRDVSP